MYYIGVQIPTREGAILRLIKGPCPDVAAMYSKQLSRGQQEYSADADWVY